MNEIIEEFNYKMIDLYADRDHYSRGRIIEIAKETLTEIIKNNSPLPSVIARNWISVEDRLPTDSRRYLVAINQGEGKITESYSSYFPKKGKFHFDMSHINWRVVAWFEIPKYEL